MATQTIKINRAVERITVRDEEGEPLYTWKVRTDDASMERMTHMDAGGTEEERKQAADAMVRLFKRNTCAIIGEQGWADVLEYIGDGEEIDPADYISDLGEVFAALCSWLWEHCSNKQLREAGVFFQGQKKFVPNNRKARRSKKKGK